MTLTKDYSVKTSKIVDNHNSSVGPIHRGALEGVANGKEETDSAVKTASYGVRQNDYVRKEKLPIHLAGLLKQIIKVPKVYGSKNRGRKKLNWKRRSGKKIRISRDRWTLDLIL